MHRIVQVQLPKLAAGHAALQHPADQLLSWLDHFLLVKLGDFWKIARLAEHQLGDAGGARSANVLPPGCIAVAHHVGGAALKGLEFIIPALKTPGDVFAHHCLEQLLFAGKVQKQRSLGDASAGRYSLYAGGSVTALDEEIQRRVEQFTRTRFLAPFVAMVRGGRSRRRLRAGDEFLTD